MAYIPIIEFEKIWDDSVTNNVSTIEKIKQGCDAINGFIQPNAKNRSFSYFSTESVNEIGETGGDVYIFCNNAKLVIAFRGTSFTIEDGFSAQDIMQDIKFNQVPLTNCEDFHHVAYVHNEFQEQYESLREFVRSRSTMLLNRYSPSEIVITGHSLGGAVSTLCALDFTRNPIVPNRPQIKVVTFGSPKVGDHIFSVPFNASVKICYRMVVKYDPFPNLPPWLPGLEYEHIGKEIFMREPDDDTIMELTPLGYGTEIYIINR